MEAVVAPVDHWIFDATDEVRLTLPPEQNDNDPPAVMTGRAGRGFTVTETGVEV